MSMVMAYAIPLAAAAGAALPAFLLWCAPHSGRGWCRKCQTPDLWIISRPTGRSRLWSLLTWLLHAALTTYALYLVRLHGSADARDWALLGLLFAGELLVGQRSRASRRRLIRCRMCEAEAEPQDLRRARAGNG